MPTALPETLPDAQDSGGGAGTDALSAEVMQTLGSIRLLCLDVDGVLTDGRLYYGSAGEEYKAFHAQDGSALKRLQASGVELAIISGRTSTMVRRRAAELGIRHLYEGYSDKLPALQDLEVKTGIPLRHMAHVGDDVPDIALFNEVGAGLSVADGHPAVRACALLVASLPGGHGAVRELAELIMQARTKAASRS